MNLRSTFATLLMSLVTALATPAFAQDKTTDPKPAVSVKNRAIEASITVDSRLKAYPGLYDNLLPEGRRELTKRRADAEAELKDDASNFSGDRRHSFERKYTERSFTGRFVSVLRSDYYYTLGAHPNREYDTIMWDTEAKKRVSFRPLFKETADNGPTMQTLAKAIRTALVVEKKARDAYEPTDTGIDSVKPKILELGPILLAPSTEPKKSSGMIAYFSPYMVGSYAEGDYTVFVPWSAFKDHLSPEGAAVFGGERPAGDDKND